MSGNMSRRWWWVYVDRPASVLFWLPFALIAPIGAAVDSDSPLPALLALAGVAALFVGAVLSSKRPDLSGRYLPELLLAAQAVVTVGGTLAFSSNWLTLFLLVGLAAGFAIRTPWAMRGIVAAGLLAGGTAVVEAASWDDADWGVGITTFLAGFTVYIFRRLAGTVAELDRARNELAVAAVAAERLRFARDLHDLLGHTLSVIVVKAEVVRRYITRDPEVAAAHAADIETIGRRALTEVRDAVAGYRAADLSRELDRARTALTAAGIGCELRTWGPPPTAEASAVLAWVVREGVTNVIRHSRARNCRIELRRDDETTSVLVADDGPGDTGPHPDLSPSDGTGLNGLRERLDASGGRLDARRTPSGFLLRAELPTAIRVGST
ncbi:MAG TPA: histidine kinase [Actinomycetes bacterium]|nr:histidine kinase [Actinomycetes bacterium]